MAADAVVFGLPAWAALSRASRHRLQLRPRGSIGAGPARPHGTTRGLLQYARNARTHREWAGGEGGRACRARPDWLQSEAVEPNTLRAYK